MSSPASSISTSTSPLLTYILANEPPFKSRARLPSLYSSFHLLRATNPDGYTANAIAWETALQHAVQAGVVPDQKDMLSLQTGEELLGALELEGEGGLGRPAGVGGVVDEAIAAERMIPREEFLAVKRNFYEGRGWARVSKRFLGWGLRQLGLGGGGNTPLPTGYFVMIGLVEEAGRKVLGDLKPRDTQIDRVWPMDRFKHEAARLLGQDSGLTDSDVRILLVHLSRDKSQVAYDDQVVKFRGSGEGDPSISTQDITIASLKSLIADLNAQIETLASKVGVSAEKARLAVSQKNRISALAQLRSRRMFENLLEKRTQALLQVEGVYVKIEEAADQVAIVQVMKESTTVLRGLNTKIGGPETVDEVIEGLRDEMTKVDDVSTVISQAGQESSGLDESAIDDELDMLEKEQHAEVEEQESQRVGQKLDSINTPVLPEPQRSKDSEKAKDSNGQTLSNTSMSLEPAETTTVDKNTSAVGRMSINEPGSATDKETQEKHVAHENADAIPT